MKHDFKRLRAALCAVLCAALLSGCAQGASSPSAAPEDTEHLDALTGQELLYPGQRAVAVVIENAPETTSQWGVSEASVVLEALTETGQSTSLCLVYPSVEAVPQVGPVTEGEDLYWRLLSGQQVLPVQRGGGVYDANYLDYYNITPVDALVVGRNAFSCSEKWSNAPAWYTSGTALQSVLESLNLSAELSASGKTVVRVTDEDGEETLFAPSLLPFDAEARLPEAYAADAAAVKVSFDENSSTSFRYNARSGLYAMYRASGTAQMDSNTRKQARFENLLILYSTSSLRDDGQTLDYDLTMGGGVWLHGGQLYNITWRQGTDETLALYDEDGESLSITPGRTYIALVASLTGDELTVTDSTGGQVLP